MCRVIALSLVGLTFLAQCHSRAVRVDSDRPTYPREAVVYRQYTQEQPLRQAQYQYQIEPEPAYTQQVQYEPEYVERPRQPEQFKRLPVIEQYLKEVSPTTKTLTEPKIHRLAEKYQAAYRAQTQQQQYQQEPKGAPVASNILAYHNALLAQQNADYEKQRIDNLKREQEIQRQQVQQQQQEIPAPQQKYAYVNQDKQPQSVIYVQQNIQKPAIPVSVKKVKSPKEGTLDEEIAYLERLQYEQQLKQHREREPPKAVLLRQYAQPQPPQPQPQPQEQVYLSDVKYQQKVVYQPVSDQEVKYLQQPVLVQYQYESEETQPKPQGRYQEIPVPKKHQNVQVEQPSEEALQKYRQNIVKYHSIQSGKSAKPKPQPVQYVQQEPNQHAPRYQGQQYIAQPQPQPQPQEVYQGPTEEEYRQSEFKASLGRNSSLRVLKSGKPIVFIGHDEA